MRREAKNEITTELCRFSRRPLFERGHSIDSRMLTKTALTVRRGRERKEGAFLEPPRCRGGGVLSAAERARPTPFPGLLSLPPHYTRWLPSTKPPRSRVTTIFFRNRTCRRPTLVARWTRSHTATSPPTTTFPPTSVPLLPSLLLPALASTTERVPATPGTTKWDPRRAESLLHRKEASKGRRRTMISVRAAAAAAVTVTKRRMRNSSSGRARD
jgi:hypothetical protein